MLVHLLTVSLRYQELAEEKKFWFYSLVVGKSSMSMSITTRPNGIATVVDVTGEITLYNAPDLRKALMDLLKVRKAPRAIVNMTKVGYIDSAGVACLVEALKVSRESKIGFALFGLNRVAREVFELTRLINVFEVYGTEEEALRGVRSTSSSATV
ncbi:MAG: STAS domain-containing protein [Candidatus Acidiferrales bacterium]